jgi:membrane fusion protein, multidrug efflux system
MQSGAPLPVDAYDREQKTRLASGTLLTVDNQIDPTTGTVKLKAQFANDDGKMFPNQFVNVRMLVDTLRGATTVPSSAVQRGVQGVFVYVVGADNTVALRLIGAGPAEGDNTSVRSGIKPGELVVVDGTDRLRAGAKVEPTTREAAAAAVARPADGDPSAGKKGGKGRRKGTE